MPFYIRVVKGLNKDTVKLLELKGHKIKVQSAMGSTQTSIKKISAFRGF